METETKPRFTTIQDVIDDPKCSEMIDSIIKEIRKKCFDMGGKLKRNALDQLDEQWFSFGESIIPEFELIARKQSQLPANFRLLITQIVMTAVERTVIFYNKLDKAK
jgi:hypothetical protein